MSLVRRGDHGDAVRRVQEALRRFGARIDDPPGVFGLWTEAAVYAVQRGEGMGADGIVGPATAARLKKDEAPAGLQGAAMQLIEGVPYFSQRDNFHHPASTCNVSALAMALAFHGVRPRDPGRQLEDELFEEITSPEGMAQFKLSNPDLFGQGLRPNTVFDMLVWVAGRRGRRATFSTDRTWDAIRAEIAARRPVILSGGFTGSGHIVLLIGLTAAGDLVCHDPWGDWMRGYRTPEGHSRVYERDQVMEILKNVGSDRKWGLFVEP